MYFGGVGAAVLGPDGLVAAGDARRDAAVGVRRPIRVSP